MEFWLSKPFSRTFPFFMMEFWLSGSLSHELFFFSRWNSGYQSLSHELFLFYDGILAIMKPFSRTFLFFTMEFWLAGSLSCELFSFFTMEFWLSGSPSHELFFFYDGILAIKAFLTNFSFFTMEFCKYAIWGKTLFIYIYISQRVFT
jgi:hypothetical protein